MHHTAAEEEDASRYLPMEEREEGRETILEASAVSAAGYEWENGTLVAAAADVADTLAVLVADIEAAAAGSIAVVPAPVPALVPVRDAAAVR